MARRRQVLAYRKAHDQIFEEGQSLAVSHCLGWRLPERDEVHCSAAAACRVEQELQRAEASRLVPFTATYPLVAAILAVLLLHEAFTVTKFAGAVLIVGGLLLLGMK